MGSSASRPSLINTSLQQQSTSPFTLFNFKWKKTSCDGAGATAATPEAPPLPPTIPTDVDTSLPSASSSSSASSSDPPPPFPNPGGYESAAMEAGKGVVTLDTHDGFRCDVSKQLSPYFAVVHSFWLGTSMLPDGRNRHYNFVAQVADETGLLMARVDPEKGTVDGRVHADLAGMGQLKLQLGLSGERGTPEAGQNDQALAEVDLGGRTWTANLKYGSVGGGLMFGGSYLQSVTRKLALGGEGLYVGTNRSLLSSYTLKYAHDGLASEPTADDDDDGRPRKMEGSAVTVANYSTAQSLLTLNYKRVVTPNRVTLAAELQCSPYTLDSQVSIGADVRLNRSRVGLAVDGTGRIQSVVEAKLGTAPGSPTLNLSSEVDHGKNVMRFGYGLNVGGG